MAPPDRRSILDEILAAKRDEATALAPERARLEREAAAAPAVRPFAPALTSGDRIAVIAEIKRRSPSKGELAPDLDAPTTAKAYAAGGASALSVLTDARWFGGGLDDLRAAREATDLPVLRKDFTVDPVQIYEARAAGADAILVIVNAIPDDGALRDLRETAEGLGMAALVEVDDAPGLERALASGATVVGITNRDLHTFGEDLSTAERLAVALPDAVVTVAESAIRGPADAERMAAAGFDAVLVGEHLVRAADPEAVVAELRVARRGGA
ncbi:MAG TPA: indole-3-glycerol phosphate synthase TrpC [Acidimicrobiia bacterium]|nr:indole-3-glycerol phosphate synthase TrpC [Acidimicrobiia bacterium]